MSVSLTLPLDDGFIRRECPHCERQFKWHSGPTDDRPEDAIDPDVYSCPYCGETAPLDEWWTRAQLEFAKASLVGPVLDQLEDDLRGVTRRNSGPATLSIERSDAEPPLPLHEPNDMQLVQSPCHPWEPMKVADDWSGALHCLVCGERFAVE